VAVKVFESPLSDKSTLRFHSEVNALKSLSGDGSPAFISSLSQPSLRFIVMDYYPGSNLMAHVEGRRLAETQAFDYFEPFVRPIDRAHASGIYIRDLKLENVLLDADFRFGAVCDLCMAIREKTFKRSVGTRCYRLGRGGADSAAVDSWGLGICLYILLAGYKPFPSENVAKYILSNQYIIIPEDVAGDAVELVRKLLSHTPAVRPSTEKILEHPWMLDCCGCYSRASARATRRRRTLLRAALRARPSRSLKFQSSNY
jgi:serine/threonine protein kinase